MILHFDLEMTFKYFNYWVWPTGKK